MESEVQFLEAANLTKFIGSFSADRFYGTVNAEGHTDYQFLSPDSLDRIVLEAPPPVESIKSFLFPAREKVAVYSSLPDQPEWKPTESTQVILGARACDLCALQIMDKIFLEGEFTDPFYEQRRRNTTILTTDCVMPGEYCFCNLVGGKPYPHTDFDLNVSPIPKGYLVCYGSEKGKKVVEKNQTLLSRARPDQVEQQEQRRASAWKTLQEQNQSFAPNVTLQDANKEKAIEKTVQHASACVECGACSYICPTCHCFLLFDQRGSSDSKDFERQKTWDSCILSNFAKMAGAGGIKPTPRPELRSRFENRIRHKFDWMMKNLNLIGCVGCGRCEAACMGGSDIREFFKELEL